MWPTTKRPFGVPVTVNGIVARVVIEGQEAQVETWSPEGWRRSNLRLADLLNAQEASETMLTALAVPREDWGRRETIEERAARIAKMMIENLRNPACHPALESDRQ